MLKKNYLLLIKISCKDRYGCYVFYLDYFKSGKLEDRLEVCCGVFGR